MSRQWYRLFVLSLGLVFVAALAPSRTAGAAARYEVLGSDPSLRRQTSVRHELGFGFSADLTEAQAAQLRARGATVRLVPVRELAAPINGKPGGGGPATAPDRVPYGVEQIYALAEATQSHPNPLAGVGIKVAVLDTGVNFSHPDLKNRQASGVSCWDFTRGKAGCSDNNGHGTHVAGTIAADGADTATTTGSGIYGVAPSATLMAGKVCSRFCWSDDIAAAIRWAADNDAHIISMSLGGDSPGSLEKAAIDYAVAKGVLVVAAAGNDGPQVGTIDYPGAFANVVGAAAIDSTSRVADFSSRGVNDTDADVSEEREVALAAAGVDVLSTSKDGGYVKMSGTSMATPHVSGTAAALWVVDDTKPRVTQRADALTALLVSVSDITAGQHTYLGEDPASGLGLPHAPAPIS